MRSLLRSLGTRLSHSQNYDRYLLDQIIRSWRRRSYVDKSNRVENLVEKFLQCDTRPRRQLSVLCVGPRNIHELAVFRKAGFGNVVGIDLFSTNEAILQMDMHVMTFPDDHFDVLFSCHSLEHSYDPVKALSEFARVTKPDGVCIIEVPCRFKIENHREIVADRQDFGSLQSLRSLCEPFLGRILFAEEEEHEYPKPDCARLAFVVKI